MGPGGGVAMWSLGVYTRKKQARGRLNLTPTTGLGAQAKAEAPSRSGRKLFAHCKLRGAGSWRRLRGGQEPRAGAVGPQPQGSPKACRQASGAFILKRVTLSVGLKRNGKTRGLQRIAEKSERSGQGGDSSRPPRCVYTSNSPMPLATSKFQS